MKIRLFSIIAAAALLTAGTMAAAGLQSAKSPLAEKSRTRIGWCCFNGKIIKSTSSACTKHHGRFFRTRKAARAYLDSRTPGWCCFNGKIIKSTPLACSKHHGRFFRTRKSALAYLDAQTPAESKTNIKVKRTISPKTKATNPRVDSFLRRVRNANSIDELNSIFKSTRFSANEKMEMRRALLTQPYVNKMKSLRRKSESKLRSRAKRMLVQKQNELEAKHKRELNLLNQQARARFKQYSMQKKKKSPKTLQRHQTTSRKSVPEMASTTDKITGNFDKFTEKFPGITSFDPQPINPERRSTLHIAGKNFRKPGESAGNVTLEIGSENIGLPLVSYSDESIRVRMPAEVITTAREEFPDILEGGIIDGVIRVHTERGATAAFLKIEISPDIAHLNPEITSVVDSDVRPGQSVNILGRNFLSRPGTVNFHFGSRTFRAYILEWSDTALLVQLRYDISGLPRTEGKVTVQNRFDLGAQHSVTFLPTEVDATLTDYFFYLGGSRDYDNTVTLFDFDLRNGWVVADRWASTHTCWVESRPSLGSSNPRYRVRCICDDCGMADCLATVIIQGPAGLPCR